MNEDHSRDNGGTVVVVVILLVLVYIIYKSLGLVTIPCHAGCDWNSYLNGLCAC